MTKPPIKFEWTLNLTHVFTLISAITIMASGYFDLKSDVRNQATRAEGKYTEYDQRWAAQRSVDDEQNAKIVRAFQEVTSQIRETKADLRTDIRDLRGDLTRRPVVTTIDTRRERERGG